MSFITTPDGVEIFYKDWGTGQSIVFHHGWPLSADEWDSQMLFFVQHGFRVLAFDRRGHGRSSQPGSGHDIEHYVSDVLALVEHLDLKSAIHVGHSIGAGEVAAYAARARPSRLSKAVLIAPVTPVLVRKRSNPSGQPLEVFDECRRALARDRAQFFLDLASGAFYGFNRPGAKVCQGAIQNWWRQAMSGAVNAQHDCIKAFSETDFTDDLQQIEIPVLVMHGDDDQLAPYATTALPTIEHLKRGALETYPGSSHGMSTTEPETINADLLEFVRD